MNFFTRAACLLALAACIWGNTAHAGIQITGTRVIYPASEREVTVNILNNGSSPRLLQAWVDSGDPRESAEDSKAPFMLTPPISRVEPGKGQALRLMFTGSGLPKDRESVYWLNVLEIPPRPDIKSGDSENFMQFAVRTRIKIFYRPRELPGDPTGSYELLSWRLVPQGSGYALQCTNPTAYNVSFNDVQLKNAAPARKEAFKGGMCPAKGSQAFPVEGDVGAANGKLVFSAINDYGGFTEREAGFSR